jgi:diguanylate cyclase (GGDEF)-like protein/PAS domain S-box-containing protein
MAISAVSLAIPVAGLLWFPKEIGDYAALAWLLALAPAFLMAYRRGWRGVATALAAGMAALSLAYAGAELLGRTLPDLLFPVILAYLVIGLGLGWLVDRVARDRIQQVVDLALLDGLTGLPNREQADRFLEKEFSAAQLGRPLAIVLFDIDRFAAFNETHGRGAGNGVLRVFATLLRQNTRRMNLSSRWGGDEFLCVLCGGAEEGGIVFAERVLGHLRAATSVSPLPTVSAGVAAYRPGMASMQALVAAAVEALEQARLDGGDRIRVYGHRLDDAEPAAAPPAGEAGLRYAPEPAGPVHAGGRALVAIRDGDWRRRLAAELAGAGYHTAETESVEDAIGNGVDYDVIVVDGTAAGLLRPFVDATRRRAPATRFVLVQPVVDGRVPVSAVEAGVHGFCLIEDGAARFAPGLDALMREAEDVRRAALRARQLAEEVRARDREARLALQASEARLQSVMQAVQEVVFRLDETGAWRLLNPAWTAITGYAVDDAIGQDALAFVHPEDRPRLADRLEAVVAGGALYLRDEVRFVTRGGELRHLEVRAQPAPGSGRGAVGTLTDVTERHRAEETLRRNEAYFRSLIEHSADLMAVAAPDATLRYASPAVRRIFGYAPGEVAGRDLFTLFHPDDVESARLGFDALLRRGDGEPLTLNVRGAHRNGTWRWLEVSLSNMVDQPGVEGVVINARDITDRRDAETARRESEALRHRTRRLDAVSRLAAGVARDFDGLLASLRQHVDQLEVGLSETDPRRASVDGVRSAVRRAATLTQQLRAFGQQQTLQATALSLNDVVRGMEPVLEKLLGPGIRIRISADARPDRVHADRTQLERVLLNLAVHARDAMPQGGQVQISTTRRTAPPPAHDDDADVAGPDVAEEVVLSVSHGGTGPAAAAFDEMFEPFLTGAGLGLSAVWGIVRQSGGRIDIEADVLDGRPATRFVIGLPALPPTGAAAARRDAQTIIVVEDDAGIRELARRVLTAAGYRVLTAGTGTDAVRTMARHPERIDLLITDVVMPEMNGKELAERMSVLRPGLKVLYMSGYPGEILLDHAVASDPASFLAKPFAPATLLEHVALALAPAAAPAD